MPITLNGDTGITTPSYGGTDAAEYLVPVTAFKNRIINGACMIDQRNAGASVTVNADADFYPVDRFVARGQGSDGVFTAQQIDVAYANFNKAIRCTVTTADASIGATQYYFLSQRIEGLNVADLRWGTANAKSVTLSFVVQSSVTGTYGGCISNSGNSRSYPFTYTISAANTETTISVTIPGDTSGTWLATNGVGMFVYFGLGVGSTYSGTAGSWAGATYLSATGSTNWISTNGATFYITGVQLEKGSTATSFDYRPYGTELALCQRYYWKSTQSANTNGGLGFAIGNGSGYGRWQFNLPVQMRATPTITQLNMTLYNFSNSANITSISGNFSTVNNISVDGAASGAVGTNTLLLVYMNGASAYADASAEL
jgi:hypothetical protein